MKKLANNNKSGILLFAKQPGRTSFSSLGVIKKSLETKKVGHTGTLDSFAQGLLVVCTGALTKLCSRITLSDKVYEAIIEFGVETDTLDPTGTITKRALTPSKKLVLPTVSELEKALDINTGCIMQVPPMFSALHVNGMRASDLARKGKEVEIEPRKVFVYSHKIIDLKMQDNKVHYAHIEFFVSKGTYIRSLARDIAKSCGTVSYLVGLVRTKVGSFNLYDAVGYNALLPFTIENVLCENKENYKTENKNVLQSGQQNEALLIDEIQKNLRPMTGDIAKLCGLVPITLKKQNQNDFFNGRALETNMFLEHNSISNVQGNAQKDFAVFLENKTFVGIVVQKQNALVYDFVIPQN